MSNILLNYGLVPDILKLKERKLLFKNYKHFYYIPDYIPDSKTHTVYIFDDNDIPLMRKIVTEVDSKVGKLHEHLEKELEALN